MGDDRSTGCIGQCDLRAFYDAIPSGLVICRLINAGFDRASAAATLRLNCFLPVRFQIADAAFDISCRTIGVLTGSRIAVALGRFLVVSTAHVI